MTERDLSEFDRVDDTARAGEFIHFLDSTSGFAAIKAIKRRTFELLSLRPGDRVLEVGCGTGEDARALAGELGSSGEVIGIDKSSEMIAEARKRTESSGLPVEFLLGDVLQLDFSAKEFDACRVERTLIHLPDPAQAVHEIGRVLRSSGRLVAFEPDLETFVIDSEQRDFTRRYLRYWCDSFQSPWIARHLPSLLKSAGFEMIRVEPVAVTFDFDLAHQILIAGTLDTAVETGFLTSAESERWVSHLEQTRDDGKFFCANMGYIVSGRKMTKTSGER